VIQLLAWSLFLAATVPGIVVAIRALPWVDPLVQNGVKPWACDICSCFWITAICAAALAAGSWNPTILLAAGPGYTGALAVLRLLQQPQSGGFVPPPLE
jgi:hypothetical protein